jgi:hypothetical protein
MKQLPDILTSTTFWGYIATLWASSGAWFTYVAAVAASRQRTYEGISSLIEGLEAEFETVSEWASGGEGEKGYLQAKTQQELIDEHPQWFNPSFLIFTFETPLLNNVTTSPHARSLSPIMRPLVRLNLSIRRLLDFMAHHQDFVASEPALYQDIVKKMAMAPKNIYSPEELVYMNFIFGNNMKIHQLLIGGYDSTDELCLYKAFRIARTALQRFKQGLRREPLPRWFWVLHIVAGALALVGVWQVMRWFEVW